MAVIKDTKSFMTVCLNEFIFCPYFNHNYNLKYKYSNEANKHPTKKRRSII